MSRRENLVSQEGKYTYENIQQRGRIMTKVQGKVMIDERRRIQLEVAETNLGRVKKEVGMDDNQNETKNFLYFYHYTLTFVLPSMLKKDIVGNHNSNCML